MLISIDYSLNNSSERKKVEHYICDNSFIYKTEKKTKEKIEFLEKEMAEAASVLEFEKAAKLRDEILL